MKTGFIGLGRMGKNIVLHLLEQRYEVVAFNRSPEPVKEVEKEGAIGAYSLEEFVGRLPKKKIIILMVTAGKPVDEMIEKLVPLLSSGDIIIDGGNSFFEDSVRRYNLLKKKGIHFIDMGTSGGLTGARNGACLTIGGDEKVFLELEPLFRDIAVKDGYAYAGPSGAGHFVKMVHNGIEYVMLEGYGEGFDVLKHGPYKLDFEKISKVWSNGSVIRSWLTELAAEAFKKDPNLKNWSGKVGGGETGRWALATAEKFKADFALLEMSIKKREKSLRKQSFGSKLISAIRNEFGGHEEPKK
ncbi:decarboxylating 6-phosphogluconate dehydrogenase [Candidatus Woesearchaeota archaeon]|nr:decarboxylating 6-phosphogluconate dehydrogenase [Candidatus Woesearchaeota archaeon]